MPVSSPAHCSFAAAACQCNLGWLGSSLALVEHLVIRSALDAVQIGLIGRATPLRGPGSIAFGDQAPSGVLALAGDDPCREDRQSLFNTFHTFAQPPARKVLQLAANRGDNVSYVSRRPGWPPEISPRRTYENQYSDWTDGRKLTRIKGLMQLQRGRGERSTRCPLTMPSVISKFKPRWVDPLLGPGQYPAGLRNASNSTQFDKVL